MKNVTSEINLFIKCIKKYQSNTTILVKDTYSLIK